MRLLKNWKERLGSSCAHMALEKADHAVMSSIFRCPGGYADWLCAGVQTLLLTPAFRAETLALWKVAHRSWFRVQFSSVELPCARRLLCFGVWCECENDFDVPGECVLTQRWSPATIPPR